MENQKLAISKGLAISIAVWVATILVLAVLGKKFAMVMMLSGATAWFYYVAYRVSKSGSKQQIPGGGTVYSDENVKITKVPQFILASMFLVGLIAVCIALLAGE